MIFAIISPILYQYKRVNNLIFAAQFSIFESNDKKEIKIKNLEFCNEYCSRRKILALDWKKKEKKTIYNIFTLCNLQLVNFFIETSLIFLTNWDIIRFLRLTNVPFDSIG